MARICVLLLTTLSVAVCCSQAPLLTSRPDVFDASSRQWMCAEYMKTFASTAELSHFTEPDNYSSELFPGLDIPSPETVEIFRTICTTDRLVVLKSLCDLYFPLLDRKLTLKKLPEDYKYFALIFSGLNPHYSDSRNRAGLWAMDYLTARRQGLRVDSLIDERRGADFTTDAAIRYLGELHRRYDGDAIKVIISWWYSPAYCEYTFKGCAKSEECIPAEARQLFQFYVYLSHRIRTLRTPNALDTYFGLFSNEEQFFFEQPTSYTAIREVLGADPVFLHQLNPVYVGNSIDPSFRKVPFSIPIQHSVNMPQLEDSLYTWKPKLKEVIESVAVEEEITHRVRRGETLGGIAARYHVTVSQLKKWNRLRNDRIREGQRIIIQRKVKKATSIPDKEPEISPPPVISDSLPQVLPETPVVVTPPPAPEKAYVIYKVRPGDSLWTIAKRYKGVTPEEIMKWNKCGENIRPGQKLRIYR